MPDTRPPDLDLPDGRYRYRGRLRAHYFSVNELYERDGRLHVLKRSCFRFFGGALLGPLAAAMSAYEYAIYRRVRDLPGVPPLGPRVGRTAYFHEFVPGRTLRSLDRRAPLADDFFPRLRATLEALHARRILYLDLGKCDNIIVGEDGRPYLIDFQACLWCGTPGSWRARLLEPLFRLLRREDRYHYCKHKRTRRPDQMTAEEWTWSGRSRFSRFHRRWLSRPYLASKRRLYPRGAAVE